MSSRARDADGLTYQEIAERLGVHYSRVQQIEKKALAKLRCNTTLKQLHAAGQCYRRSQTIGTLYQDEAFVTETFDLFGKNR